MPAARLAPLARADLKDIRRYVSQDNPEAARQLVDRLRQAVLMLAELPMSGRDRSELLPGIRSFPVGNYVIFYEVMRDGVGILRILHGSRDVDGILKG